MKRSMRVVVGVCVAASMFLFLPQAQAAQGDCNGYGGVDIDDVDYLLQYLGFAGPPPPDRAECDCDGFPGLNLGDVWQLICYIFQGGSVYPPEGTDMLVPSKVEFRVKGHPDGVYVTACSVFVSTPVDVFGLTIPYSFAPGSGDAELICTGVDFTGSVGSDLIAIIKNDDYIFTILSTSPQVLGAGTEGLLCVATFEDDVWGSNVDILPTSTDRLYPLLIAQQCYDGVDNERMFSPVFITEPVTGDCNGSGSTDIDDVVYLSAYLVGGPPPPDRAVCDCDGFPGLNIGDVHQLLGYIFHGGSLYPPEGTDIMIPSTAKFLVLGRPDGVNVTEVDIYVNTPEAFHGLSILYSFAPKDGEAELNCTEVDFTGSVASDLTAVIDNVNKIFSIQSGVPALEADDRGILCTVSFELAGNSGDPVEILPTSTARVSPMLIAQEAYDGDDGERVYYPLFLSDWWALIGDCDCSGNVDIDDVVYLIAYIFSSGPAPGDPDGDGIPECP